MNNKLKTNFFYVGLIALIWLITYVVCQIIFKQKLGWDEVAYLSVAKGIASDFDFSSRNYTIMGLLKYSYPTHLINFPVFPIYLAMFFKIFGASLKVAYFSTWLSALFVCILIYFIFLMISKDSHKLAFILSMFYLFSPGMVKNCDTALMEQVGCLLLCLSVFSILKDYEKGSFNYLTILKFAFSFLVLWLYKSLFIGYFLGAFIFICLAYNSKITEKKINTKVPLPLFLFLSYGIFVVLYYIFQKYIFLTVAPMMNFSSEQEYSQVYADFLGGYFNNFPKNLFNNVSYFFKVILSSYFIYPSSKNPYTNELLLLNSYYIYVGIYFFVFLLMILLAFAAWKKLSPTSRIFLIFSFSSIISFNLIFTILFRTSHANIWRYNIYYLPLYLCSLGIILKSNFNYIEPFVMSHPKVTKSILLLFLAGGYVPLFLSSIFHYLYTEDVYHNIAKNNSRATQAFIAKNNLPKFIYFNDGNHIVWDMYPVKQIFKDATNEQFFQVNKILSEPIEYLFLKPSDWLFKNNQELILMAAPILNNQYEFLGIDKDAGVVVYKLKK